MELKAVNASAVSDHVVELSSRVNRAFQMLLYFFSAVCFSCSACNIAASNTVYWSDFQTDQILAGPKDGSGVVVELFNISDYPNQPSSINPGGVAVNTTHVYWLEISGSILRGQKNGSGSATELFNIGDYPGAPTGAFAVDLAVDDSFVYWSDAATGQLLRGAIDGSGSVDEILSAGDYPGSPSRINPRGIDIDNTYIYWVDNASSLILRGPKDGSGVATVLFDASDYPGMPITTSPWDLSVDDEYVYWTDIRSGQLLRGLIDGTGFVDEMYTGNFLDLDVDATTLHWHTGFTSGNNIRNASKDGSGMVVDTYTGAQYPGGPTGASIGGIAVDQIPEPTALSIALAAFCLAIGKWRSK